MSIGKSDKRSKIKRRREQNGASQAPGQRSGPEMLPYRTTYKFKRSYSQVGAYMRC